MFKAANRIQRGPKPQTPRREERIEVQKAASLADPVTGETHSGTIRDIHGRGARISVPQPQKIPDKFILRSRSEGLETNAMVVWRRGYEMGVKFVAH